MEIVSLYPDNIDRRAIGRAAEALRNGELVIYPTDTHPALAASPTNAAAIAELCRLKNIDPDKHALTLVCDSIATAAQFARIDNNAFSIIKRNTPKAVTFLLPTSTTMPKALKKRKQIGVRIPDNAIALALIEEFGQPLLSGSLGESDPMELEAHISMLLSDASAEYTIDVQSSAIVDLTDSSSPEIIREGSVELSL